MCFSKCSMQDIIKCSMPVVMALTLQTQLGSCVFRLMGMTEGAWYLDKGPTVFSSILGLRELVKPLTRHLTPWLSKPKGTGLGMHIWGILNQHFCHGRYLAGISNLLVMGIDVSGCMICRDCYQRCIMVSPL